MLEANQEAFAAELFSSALPALTEAVPPQISLRALIG
jgi:hypothetical protein